MLKVERSLMEMTLLRTYGRTVMRSPNPAPLFVMHNLAYRSKGFA
jgi:hypothetical protein